MVNVDVEFYRSRDSTIFGDSKLDGFCERVNSGKIKPFSKPLFCIFDHDNPKIISKHSNGPKIRGGNVTSIVIAKPEWLKKSLYSIEFLYPESVIKTEINGRRLFLSDEFSEDGSLKGNPDIHYSGTSASLAGEPKIIDSRVVQKSTNRSMALSKHNFARAIYLKDASFGAIDFSGFEPVFNQLAALLVKGP